MLNQCCLPPGHDGYSSRTKRVLKSGGVDKGWLGGMFAEAKHTVLYASLHLH